MTLFSSGSDVADDLASLFDRAVARFPRAPIADAEENVHALLRPAIDAVSDQLARFAIGKLGSADPAVRATACYVLGRACEVSDAIHDDAAVALANLAATEHDPAVLWPLARSLGSTRSSLAVDPLVRLAGHEESVVREHAAVALPSPLTKHADEIGVRALVWLTGDTDRDVRDWATFGLGSQLEVDGPEIRAALEARLGDESSEVREEAMVGLARRRDRRALPLVAQLLEEGEGNCLVFESAAYLADPTLAPLLERYDEDDEGVHAALVECDPARRARRDESHRRLLVAVQQRLDVRWPGSIASLVTDRFDPETWLHIDGVGESRLWSADIALQAVGGDPDAAAARVGAQLDERLTEQGPGQTP